MARPRTVRRSRSGTAPGRGRRARALTWVTMATTTSGTESRIRLTRMGKDSYCCYWPATGAFADGVTVTVTVGTGVGLGFAGRTVSRGSFFGASTTTPTMSSLVKLTYGVTY